MSSRPLNTSTVVDSSRRYRATPLGLFACLVERRELVFEMIKRTVAGRYRGSVIGMAWSLAYPLMMLLVYTFVFGVVFKVRFNAGGGDESTSNFALTLFSGLIVHAFFAECMVRSPGLITGNPQYVKKVVFPLEVLPWVAVGSALFQAAMSSIVLVFFLIVLQHTLHPSIVLAPLILAPLVLMGAGVAWFLAALSVYLRDIAQVVAVLSTMLLFLSPVFYPIDALPDWAQYVVMLNPLSIPITEFRHAVVFGEPVAWTAVIVYAVIAYLVAWGGYSWFQRTRVGFADVL